MRSSFLWPHPNCRLSDKQLDTGRARPPLAGWLGLRRRSPAARRLASRACER